MMLTPNDLSTELRGKIANIIGMEAGAITNITATIQNTVAKDDFSFVLDNILKLTVVHDYAAKYAEEIELIGQLSMENYIKCFKNPSELQCVLSINTTEPHYSYKSASTTKVYHAILKSAFDPELIVPGKVVNLPDKQLTLYQITFQLVEKNILKIKNKSTNFIIAETTDYKPTIKDAIVYFIGQLGIKKVAMTPPDNTKKYRRIIIPPKIRLDAFLSYLQSCEPYGIYDAGCAWFIQDEILYIYPPYRMKPKRSVCCNFYYVGVGQCQGAASYHAFGKEDGPNPGEGFIVINSELHARYDTPIYGETVASAVMTYHDNNVIHGINTIDDAYKENLPKNTSVYYPKERTLTVQQNAENIAYTNTSANIFKHLSVLSKADIAYLGFTWNNARLGILKPAERVLFHYDGYEQMRVRGGIVSRVTYTFTPYSQQAIFGKNTRFLCGADIIISIAPYPLTSEEESLT